MAGVLDFAKIVTALHVEHAVALEALRASHAADVERLSAQLAADAQAHADAMAALQSEMAAAVGRAVEVDGLVFEVARNNRETGERLQAALAEKQELQGHLQALSDRLLLVDTRDAEWAEASTMTDAPRGDDGAFLPMDSRHEDMWSMTDAPCGDDGAILPMASRAAEQGTQTASWGDDGDRPDAVPATLDPNTLVALTFACGFGKIPAGVVLTPEEVASLPECVRALIRFNRHGHMLNVEVDLSALTPETTSVQDLLSRIALPAVKRNRDQFKRTIGFLRRRAECVTQFLYPPPPSSDASVEEEGGSDDEEEAWPLRLGPLPTPGLFSIERAIMDYMRIRETSCPAMFVFANPTFDFAVFVSEGIQSFHNAISVAATAAVPGLPMVIRTVRVFGCTNSVAGLPADSMATAILGWMASARRRGTAYVSKILEPLCSEHRVFCLPDSARWTDAMVMVCVPSLLQQ